MNKKPLITLFSLLLFACIHIQAQNFFLTTDSLFVDTVCNETTFTAQNSEKWFCFTAKDSLHEIICNEYTGTSPTASPNKLFLYSNNNNTLTLIAADTSNSYNLSINAILEKDSVYYIKVSNLLLNDMVGVCVKDIKTAYIELFVDRECNFAPGTTVNNLDYQSVISHGTVDLNIDVCVNDDLEFFLDISNYFEDLYNATVASHYNYYHNFFVTYYFNNGMPNITRPLGYLTAPPANPYFVNQSFACVNFPTQGVFEIYATFYGTYTPPGSGTSYTITGPQTNKIIVHVQDIPNITTTINPNPVCPEEEAEILIIHNNPSTSNITSLSYSCNNPLLLFGYNGQNTTAYSSYCDTYNITTEVNSICGLTSNTNPLFVEINADFTYDGGCVDNEVLFEGINNCNNYSQAQYLSWSWDFGDGGTANTQNPIHTYQHPGTYDVTLKINDNNNFFGCNKTITKQIIINELPEEPIISGRNHVCDLNYNEIVTYTILNANPNLEYQWEISDNSYPISNATILGTGNSISIVLGTYAQNWAFPLKIAVEAKDKKTNCSSIGEYWVFDCCKDLQAISPITRFQDEPINSGTYSGNIGIIGEVYANGNVVIDGANVDNVYFHPGARIYVEPNAVLTIKNSKLWVAKCDYMWDGIYIMDPTAKLILQDNTIVRDALNPVVSLNCGSYSISGNTFDNNHKDIVVKNCEDIIHGEIYANSFNETELGSGTGNYLIGHPAIGNAAPYYKHLAIEVDKVAAQLSPINYMQIGDMNQMENAFYCDYGISIDRSFVEISRNVFYEFYQNNNNPNPTGYGIKINGYLNKYSTNKNADVFIHNNRLNKGTNAIYSEFSTDLLIEDNVIRRNRGVYFAFQHDKKTVIIRNNDLFNARIAAYINPICNTQIAHNTIFFNPAFSGGTNAWAISINEYSSNTSGAYHITSNEIKNADVSIFNNNTNGILIENNTINLKNTSNPCYGILSSGSLNSKIHNNFINGKNANNLNTVGIACGLNPNTSVYCNYVRKCGHGISFAGTNPSSVKNNTMKRNHYGLTLRVNGYIGDQGSPTAPCDNSWQQNNFATYCFDSYGHYNTLYVRNWNNYNPIIGLHYEPQPSAYSAFAKSVHNVSSYPTPCVINAGPGGGNLGQIGLFHKIAKKQIQYASHQAEKEWISEKELYKMLKHDSIASLLLQTDTILSVFVDSVEQSNLGTLEETKELMAAENMQGAKLSNEMLTPSVQTEYYEKMLNEIMINYTLSNFQTIPNAILDSLRVVAQMCPFEQGVAVYRARALLSHYDTIVYVNICEQGDENQYRSSEQIKDILNTKDADNLMLYPNPTNEILYIEINNDEDIDYFFEIADLSGRIVLRENIRLTKTSIDVSKLAKGSYIYNIKNSEQIPLKTDKLIIM